VWAPQPSGAEASRCCLLFLPLAALPPPFSYTHRPGRSGAHEPAGAGVDFPTPRNSFVRRLLKMGSRARTRGERPAPTAACPGRRCRGAPVRPTLDPDRPTLYPALPTRLPSTPPGQPYTRPSQPAYPIPPTDLPYTWPSHATSPSRPTLYYTAVATYTRILHRTRPPEALSLPDLPHSIVS